jgi:hypothetical protein
LQRAWQSRDAVTFVDYTQLPNGERRVVYLQPGHFVEEFTDPGGFLNQLIDNAITWRPEPANAP